MRSTLIVLVSSSGLLCACATTESLPASRGGSESTTSTLPHRAPAQPAGEAGLASPGYESVLHNVHVVTPGLTSGAVPEGDAAFAELAARGFKTIISVDGSSPDVEGAARRGLRYVHIPITYSEATPEQQLEIARAVRDLPGPIYLHCHHGKHRGPAAAASAAVLLGQMTPEQGVAFMKEAGTAAGYTGLYACVASARVATAEELNAAPSAFAPVRCPAGMTAAMVEIDIAHEHLQEIRAAGWATPTEHPDLVPAAEAGRLADHLRTSAEDPKAQALGDDFMERLRLAVDEASALEDTLQMKPVNTERAEAAWKLVAASCTSCHTAYRNSPIRKAW